MLDNIDHLKVLWNYLGVDDALDILSWGANDLSATQLEEKVIVMAGGVRINMTREKMKSLIQQENRIPCEAHSAAR